MSARSFRRELLGEMKTLNAHLALICEVIQKPEKGLRADGLYLSRIEKAIRERPPAHIEVGLANAEQPLADAMELLARRLWLELPDESKADLS